jgi:hypothetical protein
MEFTCQEFLMRKVAVAEWILSSTMPRENAVAAAGDLAESFEGMSFWASLARLAGSASLRKFARSPLNFLWTAILLWLAFLLASTLYAAGAWLLWAILYLADNHTGLELLTERLGHRMPLVPPSALLVWAGLVLLPAVAGWKIGAEMSRKSPGLELPVWFAIAVMWTILGLATKLPLGTIFVPLFCVLGGMLRSRWVDPSDERSVRATSRA